MVLSYFAGETEDKTDTLVYEVSGPNIKQECQSHLIMMFADRNVMLMDMAGGDVARI